MKILSRNDQSGRSMVEMLGVLAIIGVLSVGGISGYSKAMAKFKLTKAQDQITMLLMNIRTAFATSPSYDGLTTSTAIAYNIAPSDMVTADANIGTGGTATGSGTLSNAFGGSTKVSACDESEVTNDCKAVDSSAESNLYFAIQLTRLAKETCVSLGSSDWGSDGLVGVKINEKTFTPTGGMPTMFTAGEACTSTETDYSTITWVEL